MHLLKLERKKLLRLFIFRDSIPKLSLHLLLVNETLISSLIMSGSLLLLLRVLQLRNQLTTGNDIKSFSSLDTTLDTVQINSDFKNEQMFLLYNWGWGIVCHYSSS